MPASRTIAFATVLCAVALGGASGCSSVFNRLEDGVVRDDAITEVTLSGGSGDVSVKTDATVKGIDIRRTVTYLGQPPSIADTITFTGAVVKLSTECGPRCTVSYDVRMAKAGVTVKGVNGSGDLVVADASDVDVKVGSGDVTVHGASGNVKAETGSGDIVVTDLAGSATLSTGSGDVSGSDLRGTLTSVDVSSGDITLTLPGTGNLTATTGSGDIDISVPNGTCRITATSASGNASIGATTDPASQRLMDLRTSSGDITVRPAQ